MAAASENHRMDDSRLFFPLDITVFSFHGCRTRRRQYRIDGMHAEASIAHLKQKVKSTIGGTPYEFWLKFLCSSSVSARRSKLPFPFPTLKAPFPRFAMCCVEQQSMMKVASENHRMDDSRPFFPLHITVFSFHGYRTHRRQYRIDGMHAEASVAHLKQKVKSALGGTPYEFELLVGGSDPCDSSSLSKCGIRSPGDSDRVRALAHFELPLPMRQTMTGMEAYCWDGTITVQGSSNPDDNIAASLLDSSASSATDYNAAECQLLFEQPQDLLNPDIQPDKPRQRVPPLLLQRKKRLALPPEERSAKSRPSKQAVQASIDDSSIFELDLQLSIFLGKHGHQRCCSMPASKDTSIREIEDRLLDWLGSPPSELGLSFQGIALERERAMSDYKIGASTTIVAIAWYAHIRNSDLSLARSIAEEARPPSR
eukprot:CAMPEP_0179125194 /NCGR_PEP_ID=MMETSP0796-20121207/59196_1 /TAXON_ID=73915 /ORGANISM="Pyrodinium bahamense, Strain pbaha01" /LENGTH=425 /DNA_ID=CAMNT_0020823881 /DNA_START=96 /DNA_END=1373 /DNA_ORIENTATION=+